MTRMPAVCVWGVCVHVFKMRGDLINVDIGTSQKMLYYEKVKCFSSFQKVKLNLLHIVGVGNMDLRYFVDHCNKSNNKNCFFFK